MGDFDPNNSGEFADLDIVFLKVSATEVAELRRQIFEIVDEIRACGRLLTDARIIGSLYKKWDKPS